MMIYLYLCVFDEIHKRNSCATGLDQKTAGIQDHAGTLSKNVQRQIEFLK
jgi:hypothetical protein